jgi:hypothetical protein
MANDLLTIDMITREAQRVAHEKLSFLGTIDRSYDDSFAKNGAKIGSTLRIRKPNQYTRRQGSRVMDVQEQAEESQTLTVATQDGVDMRFNSAELALDIDNFSVRYIEPAVKVLVAGIEGDVIESVSQSVYNLTGTAGTVVGTSGDISAITLARGRLNQYLAPKSDRSVVMDSITMGTIVNGNKALFHDGAQVKEAFREGFYSRGAGADWYENEKTYVHTNGADHTTVTVNDTVASGDAVITLAGATLSVGTTFTIADVKAVHPETKAPYSHDQQFVVTAVNGNDYSISPPIISTGAKQNVDHLPSTSDVVTAFGTASLLYRQNLMYHKEAFTFVTADLPLMDDAHKCVRRVQDNLSMRVWQGSDIRNDELLMRIDILYGFKAIRPEWAVRISN